MIEEISPITDNISIEDWADKIHEIKTNELAELVAKKEAEFKPYLEAATVNSFKDVATALEGLLVGVEMINLKVKLKILKEHGRK